MTLNPATWPVGILPIVFFVLGIVQLFNIVLLRNNPTRDTVGLFMFFVPSVLVVIAWLAGYQHPSDHALWKFTALSIVGGAIWIPLRFNVLSKSEVGEEMRLKLKTLGIFQLWRNLAIAIGVFIMICGVFALMEPRLKNPQECTRLMCDVGVMLLGSQYSSVWSIWILLLFSTFYLMAAIVNLVTLFKRYVGF